MFQKLRAVGEDTGVRNREAGGLVMFGALQVSKN